MLGCHTPWDQGDPPAPGPGRHPPRTRQTPPRTRQTPLPGTRQTPPQDQADPPGTRQTPQDQADPPGPGKPPWDQADTPPPPTPPGSKLQHTVYEWPVRILLECIHVTSVLMCVTRGVVSTGPLARCHLIWPLGHLLLNSTGPEWPPKFKAYLLKKL